MPVAGVRFQTLPIQTGNQPDQELTTIYIHIIIIIYLYFRLNVHIHILKINKKIIKEKYVKTNNCLKLSFKNIKFPKFNQR